MKLAQSLDIVSCVNLVNAVIDPSRYIGPGYGRKRDQRLPPLGSEWFEVAAEILDVDPELVSRAYKEQVKRLKGAFHEDGL